MTENIIIREGFPSVVWSDVEMSDDEEIDIMLRGHSTPMEMIATPSIPTINMVSITDSVALSSSFPKVLNRILPNDVEITIQESRKTGWKL